MDDFTTGGWTLHPTNGYLAAAESFDDLRARFAEADTVLDDLARKRREYIELLRKQRRLELKIAKLEQPRRAAREWYGHDVETEQTEEARRLQEELAQEIDEIGARVEEARAEYDRLSRHIGRTFNVVPTDRSRLDLTPPDPRKVKAEVGTLVGHGAQA